MAYKMKGFNYPGTSPLDQLSAASKKANAEPSPFHKGGVAGMGKRRKVLPHGEESHHGEVDEVVDYEETSDSELGAGTGMAGHRFSKGNN
jgi:hypothetical protein|tara:strand:+ start:106 stop:375 length:270 start_codon:yes stop_codon:yes gene_type:complete